MTEGKPDLRLIAERERIARGIGVSTVHRLFGIGLRLQAMSLRHREGAIAADLERCLGELDETIVALRAAVFDLEPPDSMREPA